MILYLDTSSLAKMYIEEAGSSLVREWAEDAEILATCRVAYPEMVSALSRHFRGGTLSRAPYDLLLEPFPDDWKHFAYAVAFSSFDQKLDDAAAAEGLTVLSR